jgi:Tol biopolymer transport system component
MAELPGKILFTSGKAGDSDLWRLDLSSGGLGQLTFGSWRNAKGRWSPDGQRIVYVSNQLGPSDLWVADANGQNEARLTSDDRWYDHPDWSPDGTRIVCCSNRDGAADNEIWIYTLQGGSWERLTECAASDSYPAWSPDGQRIAFTSSRSGSDDVWVLELAGRRVTQLTTAPGRDFAPAWSPDGTRIAFVADRAVSWRDRLQGEPDLDVWLMNADGTEQRRLTTNQGTDRCVSWSPDGTHLVYSASKVGDAGERLWVLPVGETVPAPVGMDRAPLEAEIGAHPVGVGLFSFFPDSLVRRFYPDSYFGTETYPHWAR